MFLGCPSMCACMHASWQRYSLTGLSSTTAYFLTTEFMLKNICLIMNI